MVVSGIRIRFPCEEYPTPIPRPNPLITRLNHDLVGIDLADS